MTGWIPALLLLTGVYADVVGALAVGLAVFGVVVFGALYFWIGRTPTVPVTPAGQEQPA